MFSSVADSLCCCCCHYHCCCVSVIRLLAVLQAAIKLVEDLQHTDKDMFVLRALLELDAQGDGSQGGDWMILAIHKTTPPEIWLHCMVCD